MSTRIRSEGANSSVGNGSTLWFQTGTYAGQPASWYLGGPTTDIGQGELVYDLQTMEDSTGNTDRMPHSVNHQKWSGTVRGTTESFTVKDVTSGGTRTVRTIRGPGRTAADCLVYGLPTIGNELNVAKARVPAFNAEMLSGLNSLYEIGDLVASLRRLPVHIVWAWFRGRRKFGAADTRVRIKELLKHLRTRRGLSDMLQSLIGADLAWKFGWAPFVTDVQKTLTALEEIELRFVRLAAMPFVCRGRHQVSVSDNPTGSGQVTVHNPSWEYEVTCARTTTVTWVAGCVRKINAQGANLSDLISKQRLLAEQLGLTLEAKDLWEAVPFSFVVDWFIPICDFIEQFEGASSVPPSVQTVAQWVSTKTSVEADVRGRLKPINVVSPFVVTEWNKNPSVAAMRRSSYVRVVGPWEDPPVFLPALRPINLSWAKVWTGTELALQRMRSLLRG